MLCPIFLTCHAGLNITKGAASPACAPHTPAGTVMVSGIKEVGGIHTLLDCIFTAAAFVRYRPVVSAPVAGFRMTNDTVYWFPGEVAVPTFRTREPVA